MNSMLALILLLASIALCSAGWRKVNRNLIGRVIHVESLRQGFRGRWLDASSNGLQVTECAAKDIYYKPASQFLVTSCDDGHVCLESLSRRNYYIDAHHSGWAKVSYSTYPKNKKWAQWDIQCTSSAMTKCAFFAVRWGNQNKNKYLDTHHSWWVAVSKYGKKWSNFRILAPKPSESWRVAKSITNYNGAAVTYTVKYTVGISKSRSVSNSITTEVNIEVQRAFVSASASLSHMWTETKTSTFKASREFTMKIPVQPYTRVQVKQRVGNYGPFQVNSKHFEITCFDLRTNKKCIHSRAPPKVKI